MTRKLTWLIVLAAMSFSGIASMALADDSKWQSKDDPIQQIIRNRQKCGSVCKQSN